MRGTRRTTTRPTGGSPTPRAPARPASGPRRGRPGGARSRGGSRRPPSRSLAWSQSASHRVRRTPMARTRSPASARPRSRPPWGSAVAPRALRRRRPATSVRRSAITTEATRREALADQVTNQGGLEELAHLAGGDRHGEAGEEDEQALTAWERDRQAAEVEVPLHEAERVVGQDGRHDDGGERPLEAGQGTEVAGRSAVSARTIVTAPPRAVAQRSRRTSREAAIREPIRARGAGTVDERHVPS